MINKTIAEIVKENAHAAKIFDKYQIDYCCGGKMNFEDICRKKNLNSNQLIQEMGNYHSPIQNISFQEIDNWPADLICDYIEKTHHRFLKEFFELLSPKLTKLVLRHGDNHPELKEIEVIMNSAQYELLTHLKKEELILFPAIRKYFQINNQNIEQAPFGSIENPIKVMESDHYHEGERLEVLKKLSSDFTPPEDACQTYKSVFNMLKEFSEDMHRHVYIENHILFPKALSLENNLKEQNHVF
jgi:regulator of cell morphogenesis and NO signaling